MAETLKRSLYNTKTQFTVASVVVLTDSGRGIVRGNGRIAPQPPIHQQTH